MVKAQLPVKVFDKMVQKCTWLVSKSSTFSSSWLAGQKLFTEALLKRRVTDPTCQIDAPLGTVEVQTFGSIFCMVEKDQELVPFSVPEFPVICHPDPERIEGEGSS